MSALLTLTSVSKTFENATRALDGLDLVVNRGEFVSLLGPSGCGKSTALRMIAGLLKPDKGAVDFPGGRPPIGFVFQEPTLMPWAKTLDNVRLPLDLEKTDRAKADKRAARALARVGLSGFEGAYPRELSGGMKMRVSVARAIASGAKLLLMDEPFAALDELTRQALNDDLLKLWQEDDLTVVFVTHSVYESVYLSSRIAVITPRPGRVADNIELPSPRSRDASYRLNPQFVAAAGRVSISLRGNMDGQGRSATSARG
jgi:NitT/TauT family transport system ATP-binding protein